MSYRIAGIDVHKKMLVVVVSAVEVDRQRPHPLKYQMPKDAPPFLSRVVTGQNSN